MLKSDNVVKQRIPAAGRRRKKMVNRSRHWHIWNLGISEEKMDAAVITGVSQREGEHMGLVVGNGVAYEWCKGNTCSWD